MLKQNFKGVWLALWLASVCLLPCIIAGQTVVPVGCPAFPDPPRTNGTYFNRIYAPLPELDLGMQTEAYKTLVAPALVPLAPALVTGEGSDPANHTLVRVFNRYQAMTAQFLAYPASVLGGVQVSAGSNGVQTVIATAPISALGTAEVRVFDTQGALQYSIIPGLQPPYAIATGRFLSEATGNFEQLAVVSQTLGDTNATVAVYSLASGALLKQGVLTAVGNPGDSLQISDFQGSPLSKLLVFNQTSQKAILADLYLNTNLSYSLSGVSAQASIYQSAFTNQFLAATYPEPNLSHVTGISPTLGTTTTDVGHREDTFWAPTCHRTYSQTNYTQNGGLIHFVPESFQTTPNQNNWPNVLMSTNPADWSYSYFAVRDYNKFFNQATWFLDPKNYTNSALSMQWGTNGYLSFPFSFQYSYIGWSFNQMWNPTDYIDAQTGLPAFDVLLTNNAVYNTVHTSYTMAPRCQQMEAFIFGRLRSLAANMAVDTFALTNVNMSPETRVLGFANGHELTTRGNDYNPFMIRAFQSYLTNNYQTVSNINFYFGTSFNSVTNIDPPRGMGRGAWDTGDFANNTPTSNPYWNAWLMFKEYSLNFWLVAAWRECLMQGWSPGLLQGHQMDGSQEAVRYTSGKAEGFDLYGYIADRPNNIFSRSQTSGQNMIMLGEYGAVTPPWQQRAQADYMWSNGVMLVCGAGAGTTPSDMDQDYYDIEQQNLPRPGVTGGTGPLVPVVYPATEGPFNYTTNTVGSPNNQVYGISGSSGRTLRYNIVQLGTGSGRNGLLKSVTTNGTFQGSVYLVPFHGHVDVDALQINANGILTQDGIVEAPMLSVGDQIEIQFNAQTTNGGIVQVWALNDTNSSVPGTPYSLSSMALLNEGVTNSSIGNDSFQWSAPANPTNRGVALPYGAVSWTLPAGNTNVVCRYVFRNQTPGAQIMLVLKNSGGTTVNYQQLNVSVQRELVSVSGFRPFGLPHRGGVTLDVLSRQLTPATRLLAAYPPNAPVINIPLQLNSGPVTNNLLAQCSDPDGGLVGLVSVGAPAHGTAQISGTNLVYTPAGNFLGADSFSYVITNSEGLSATGMVSVIGALAPPAVLTWNATGSVGGPQDGSGIWNGSGINWWTGANNMAWADGPNPVFGFSAGGYTVQVASGFTPRVSGLTFNTNYNLSGGIIDLGSGSDTVQVTNNSTAAVNSVLQDGGLVKTGAGILVLGGDNVYAAGTTVSAGSLLLGQDGALGYGGVTLAAGTSLGWLASNAAPFLVANDLLLSGNDANPVYTIADNGGQVTLAGVVTAQNTLNPGLLSLNAGGTNSTIVLTGNVNLGAKTLGCQGSGSGSGAMPIQQQASSYALSDAILNAQNLDLGNLPGLNVYLAGSTTATLPGGVTGGTNSCSLILQDSALLKVLALLMTNGNQELTLNGGTLNASNITLAANSQANLFWNGGTIQATASTTNLITGAASQIRIQNGGAQLDVGGNNIGMFKPLLADTAQSVGGLTKLGSGVLTLGVSNSFNGPLVLVGGKLQTTALGALGKGNINFNGGNLNLSNAASMTTSQPLFFNAPSPTLSIDTSTAVTFTGNVTNNYTGTDGTFTVAQNPNCYPTSIFANDRMELGADDFYVKGWNVSDTCILSNCTLTTTSGNIIGNQLGAGITIKGTSLVSTASGYIGGTFPNFYFSINDQAQVSAASLYRSGKNCSYTLNGGVLSVGYILFTNYSSTLNLNGGVLRAGLGASNNFVMIPTNTILNVQNGGAFIDTQTNSIAVGAPFINGGSGGLTKLGAGTLTLTATNTYVGNTTISNGTLALSCPVGAVSLVSNSPALSVSGGAVLDVGAVASGFHVLNGQTLSGLGSVKGGVTVDAGGVLTVGGASGTPGTITFSNNLTLGGTTRLRLNKGGVPACDLVQLGSGVVTYGGSLAISSVGGALAGGDSFKLFNAGSYAGGFSSLSLPALGTGLSWNTNQLLTAGILAVVPPYSTTPTNLTYAATNNSLVLNWPADHLGWRLVVQTNSLQVGLTTNWTTVAGSTLTNSMTLPMTPTNGAVFYRLVFP